MCSCRNKVKKTTTNSTKAIKGLPFNFKKTSSTNSTASVKSPVVLNTPVPSVSKTGGIVFKAK